jgi:hypothetical protein
MIAVGARTRRANRSRNCFSTCTGSMTSMTGRCFEPGVRNERKTRVQTEMIYSKKRLQVDRPFPRPLPLPLPLPLPRPRFCVGAGSGVVETSIGGGGSSIGSGGFLN